jgi:hypothetical protein
MTKLTHGALAQMQ